MVVDFCVHTVPKICTFFTKRCTYAGGRAVRAFETAFQLTICNFSIHRVSSGILLMFGEAGIAV
jgi:hypothetical protein